MTSPAGHAADFGDEHSVVILDDDEIFRNRLCRAFESRHWRAQGVGTTRAALAAAEQTQPDLVLVDLRLSGENGLDIVSTLRAIDAELKIIMLTGYGSIATALTATKLGADDYVSKPADVDQILLAYQRLQDRQENDRSAAGPAMVPSLARVEWEHIQRVLTDCGGNISQAARLLGLHRRSLQRKLEKYPPHQ